MPAKRHLSLTAFVVLACAACHVAGARDLKITIPGRSELTPVQRLNREGVDAIQKHQYDKAEGFFYKAYLYDPADPFTLNNLGYIAELQGQVDRAEKFYKLSTDQGSRAIIDRSSAKELRGRPITSVMDGSRSVPMHINRINILGLELLSQDRPYEAEALLKTAFVLDPHNPFTLNNLGVAEEATGNFEDALKYYDEAASSRSKEPIVITLKNSWRGKPVSDMAASSAQDLRKRMQKTTLTQERAAMLAMRGVAATNRNDYSAAKKDFLEAYSLDPLSAFALNNLGYVTERDGDPETAQYYYGRARKAGDAANRIGSATQAAAQGRRLSAIADENVDSAVNSLDAYSLSRRGQKGQSTLKTRNPQPAKSDMIPSKPATETPPDVPSPPPPTPQ